MAPKDSPTWAPGTDQRRRATGVILGVFALPLLCTVILVIIQVIVH